MEGEYYKIKKKNKTGEKSGSKKKSYECMICVQTESHTCF